MAASLAAAALGIHAVGRLVRANRALTRKALEAMERESHLLATTGEWIWSLDTTLSVVSSNVAVERLLGRTVADVIGVPWTDLAHPDERDAATSWLRSLLAGSGEWVGWRMRFERADGEIRWLESSAITIISADGRVSGYRGATRDVTAAVLSDRTRTAASDARVEKQARIRRVLEQPDSALRIVFQPIVARDGTIAGVEALARFPIGPPRAPDEWFAEAAEVGLGVELEVLALRTAVRQLDRLPAGYVAVNVSPNTLLALDLNELAAGRDDVGTRLVLELTEHIEVVTYGPLRVAIAKLRAAGVRVSVDDAGAGYASLQHILEIRPDFIKLDRSMVTGIAVDPVRRALVSAVTDFAANIRADVIAEGVEELADLRALHDVGVRWTQGYLVGRPSPPPISAARLPTNSSSGR